MDRPKLMEDIERTLFYNEVEVGRDEIDKSQAAMAKLFMPEHNTHGIPAFDSLRDAYIHFSGDEDVNGMFYPDKTSPGLRSCMSFDSTTFSYALANVLNLQLSKMYKSFPYREEILISEKKNVKDFRLIDSIQLGYYGDLPDIDPESGDYDDMESYDDTKAEYRLGQKGAVIWVTRYHIINDSIDLVKGMVKRLARSARMTHAKYVWAFYIGNATCPDGTVWFTSGHGNLGGDALDIDPLITAITALANMTEPGSEEKIGLDLNTFNWNLVLPIDLWDLGVKKNQNQYYYSSNDLTDKVPNACYSLFGARNERIVTCPFMTDANDWGVIRDKEDVPIVEMSYLNGRYEPELIVEEGPTQEHVFTADKIGYKIRHEYGGVLTDYRGGYKSVL
jgi:hypothetical protein